jgi:hypothetical protein
MRPKPTLTREPDKVPKTEVVLVVGAGFSEGLGYPLTRHLLPLLAPRLNRELGDQFRAVVSFHHPRWDGREATLPEVEEFLTALTANQDLLHTFRPKGRFGPKDVRRFREELLRSIANWFHEIHEKPKPTQKRQILSDFVRRVKSKPNSAIISFNWDYELDKALFRDGGPWAPVSPARYGLDQENIDLPQILKPHGSLNWYRGRSGRRIRRDLRIRLWKGERAGESMYSFLRWREPRSSTGHRYLPWIIPPTHWKDFRHPMMKQIWKRCVDCLSVAKRVYFLGYSLPEADWHSKYVFRCGFHNQTEGFPPLAGPRGRKEGKAEVFVVNPDVLAFRRIEATVGWNCRWIPTTIAQWLTDSARLV